MRRRSACRRSTRSAPCRSTSSDQWGSERGFPGGPVYALTQTADGYLWIGGEKGLVRFDGLSFRLFEPTGLPPSAGPTVLGVTAAPDGNAVGADARTGAGAAAQRRVREHSRQRRHARVGDHGDVTAVRATSCCCPRCSRAPSPIATGRFTTIAAPGSLPTSSFIISIATTSDGDVWLGTRDAGLLRVRGSQVTRIMEGLPDPKINCLLAGEHGDLWIGTDKGVARWTGGEVTRAGVPAALSSVPALAMIRDRDAERLDRRGLARPAAGERPRRGGDCRAPGARHRGAVTAVFEDRDGNIWVGTTRGIERLRDGVFTTYATAQGLPSDSVGAGPRRRGRSALWFAPSEGGLYWLHDGRVQPYRRGRPARRRGLFDCRRTATRSGSGGSAAA